MTVQVIPTSFQSDGETIRGHFVLPRGKGPFLGICKYHGLPGSPDQVSGFATRLAEVGFAVLTFDFRGFRTSQGRWSLANEVQDAQNAITHLLAADYVRAGWVGVYGASFGGAVAVLAAARDARISAMCLRAPVFDTLAFVQSPIFELGLTAVLEMAPDQVHGITDPTERRVMLDRVVYESKTLNPMNEIATIFPRPLLIITGDADLGIPVEGVRHLFNLAPEPKELIIVKGADHNLSTPQTFEETVKKVQEWFLSHVP